MDSNWEEELLADFDIGNILEAIDDNSCSLKILSNSQLSVEKELSGEELELFQQIKDQIDLERKGKEIPKRPSSNSMDNTNRENEILRQINDEIELENKYGASDIKPFEALKDRLNALKLNKIVQFDNVPNQLSTKVQLKKKLGSAPKAVDISDFDNEMEKWCCICNEDGNLICISCDNDVYCTVCWNQGHDDSEFGRHIKKSLSCS